MRTKISADVENVLHRCFVAARSAGHRFATVENMALEMLKEPGIVDHLKASRLSAEALRSAFERTLSKTEVQSATETEPTSEFQKVVQRAILDAQTSGCGEVSLIDLWASISRQLESLFGKRG